MKLVFVHGWSVTDIDTYGELPEVLKREAPAELDLEIENIYLGEYISFHDEVTLYDIARAFESARLDKLGENQSFACITHSTGGPVIRLWLELFYKDNLSNTPLSHLIMLAPANHGSSLAALGKAKVGRIKAWFSGVEPGVGVLNWLQLGSIGQWDLNTSWLDYKYDDTFYPFVLSGEKIDNHFYDFLNNYLVEKGSDGVVRLTGANMNYRKLTLKQDSSAEELDAIIDGSTMKAYPLVLDGEIKSSTPCAFEVIKDASHSGDKYGIMGSVKKRKKVKPVVTSIIESLQVNTNAQYQQTIENMKSRTNTVQGKKEKYVMFIFNISDQFSNKINDYDMILLAGNRYEPSKLPKGFFVDRQKNNISGHLVYYLNYNKLKDIKDGKFGIRIVARPDKGFSHYKAAEFRSESITLKEVLYPNQTLMVDVILERKISKNTFVLDKFGESSSDNGSFKNREVGSNFIK
jgi:hypothetical protein